MDMIVEKKSSKALNENLENIKLFDFTAMSDEKWQKVFSKMRKHLPYQNIQRPFYLGIEADADGEALANLIFVAEEKRVHERTLKFKLRSCVLENHPELDETLTKIWNAFMRAQFKYFNLIEEHRENIENLENFS